MKKIVLASGSARRIELLKQWGVKFEVCPSGTDETTTLKKPSSIVKNLALKKALEVAQNPRFSKALIIAADTIVVLNGRIVGKPANKRESKKIIEELNGSRHKVYTGVALVDCATKKQKAFYDIAIVKMRTLSAPELAKLFGKHLDKAGSYAAQDKGDNFVESIRGDYYAVVGLPYKSLKKEIKKFGISLKSLKN
ncbi:MAG: Maf family protein [Elusimicrobia bacterium]|nr:Maf family protein [Elusimicrobiota bacterium]